MATLTYEEWLAEQGERLIQEHARYVEAEVQNLREDLAKEFVGRDMQCDLDAYEHELYMAYDLWRNDMELSLRREYEQLLGRV